MTLSTVHKLNINYEVHLYLCDFEPRLVIIITLPRQARIEIYINSKRSMTEVKGSG